jgi:hypothetical protein
LAALAVAAAGSWSVYAIACDKNKTQASAANATTASYKSAGAGSCAGKSAATTSAVTASSSASGCAAHTTAATAASHEGCGGSVSGASAVTASTAGAKSMKVAGADGCCSAKGAKSAKATTASNGDGACGMAMAGVASCSGQALTMAMCKESHAGCDACEDMGTFDAELTSASAAVQVLPIKNGVMFVYSAAAPGKVNALQSAVTRRSEQLQKIVAAGEKAHLCDGCKSMRGAMASGKVTREVVNIEGGALTLVTSNDPALVRQIRAMADAGKTAARVKS